MAFKRTGGRKCKFESLETRRMFAGDVTAEVHGGTAEIEGDFFSNAVVITPGANPNEVVVTGVNDSNGLATNVNGLPNGSITLPGVIHGLEVKMGFGDDAVTMTNLTINGKSKVDMGEGVDSVTVTGSLFKSDLTIKTGRSMDTVTITNTTVRGTLQLKTGTGGDVVSLTGVNAGKLKVGLGEGNDVFTVAGTTVTTESILNGDGGINPFTDAGSNFYGGFIHKKHLNGGWGG